MAKFPSTLLPTSSDPTETRKAILDLLEKLNKLADGILPVANPRAWDGTYVYSNMAPVADTFYTVTIGNLPIGTKMVWIAGYIDGTHAGGTHIVWRPFGSTDTRMESACRMLGLAGALNDYALISGPVAVDSKGRFEICVTNANANIIIFGYSFAWSI